MMSDSGVSKYLVAHDKGQSGFISLGFERVIGTQEPRKGEGERYIYTNAKPSATIKQHDYRATQFSTWLNPKIYNSVSLNIHRNSPMRKKMVLMPGFASEETHRCIHHVYVFK